MTQITIIDEKNQLYSVLLHTFDENRLEKPGFILQYTHSQNATLFKEKASKVRLGFCFIIHDPQPSRLTEITHSDDVIDLLSQHGRIRTGQQPASSCLDTDMNE